MRLHHLLHMTLSIAVVDCMMGCVTPDHAKVVVVPQRSVHAQTSARREQQQTLHHVSTFKMPITATLAVNADIYYPAKPAWPKTLVIIVPGSGNISRLGEVAQGLHASEEWAKALSNQGFFVLSYDKRTCQHGQNPQCESNGQKDIDQQGIKVLAEDLDQAYQAAIHKLNLSHEQVRVVLLSSTQGAQAISLSQCGKLVNGIALFSPIIGNLEAMWVKTLDRARQQKSTSGEKNHLINRKESMVDFFESLKEGKFPENATFRGASIKFWMSWIEASKHTLGRLEALNKPTLLLFSSNDDVSDKNALRGQDTKYIQVKYYSDCDRNFVTANGVPKRPLNEILMFINKLGASIPTFSMSPRGEVRGVHRSATAWTPRTTPRG